MGRGPLSLRFCKLSSRKRAYAGLAALSRCCPPQGGRFPRDPQPCATHAAEAARVRLACIRHAASVRPEPGSNSSLCGMECRVRHHNHPEVDGIRVHHHDSVVKVQLPFDSRARANKKPGVSSNDAWLTPGDVSGHTAGAFRKGREAREPSCYVYRVSSETTAETTLGV